MTQQDTDQTRPDILPRDQLEHYKIELAQTRAENDRLMSEVSYLRQALAAALTKVPQIEGSVSPDTPSPLAQDNSTQESRWPWEQGPHVRYFSLAPLLVSPLVLLTLVMISLVCSILSFGFYIILGY